MLLGGKYDASGGSRLGGSLSMLKGPPSRLPREDVRERGVTLSSGDHGDSMRSTNKVGD